MLRLLFAFSAALAAAAAAAPAAAQIVGRTDYGPAPAASPFLPDSSLPGASLGAELRHIRGRIAQAREAGLISRAEARALRREAAAIGRAAQRYERDTLSDSERRELALRTQSLRDSLARRRPPPSGG